MRVHEPLLFAALATIQAATPAIAAGLVTDATRDLNRIVNETMEKAPNRALDRDGWEAVVKERQCPGPALATTPDPNPVPLCVRKRGDPPPTTIKIPS